MNTTSGSIGLFVDPMVSNIFTVVICLASGKVEVMAANKEFRQLNPGSSIYVKRKIDAKLINALLKDKSKVYL